MNVMRRWRFLLLVPVVAAAASTPVQGATAVAGTSTKSGAVDGSSGIGDPYDPRLGNGGYDATRYDIDADWDATTLAATARIDAVVGPRALRRFQLDFGPRRGEEGDPARQLVVSNVTVDGRRAASSTVDGELIVTPSVTLRAGREFTVVVTYRGRPERFPTRLEGGWRDLSDGTVVVFGEPRGASSWYPVNDHPSDKAEHVLTIRVPTGVEVAANGTGTPRVLADGRVEWTVAGGGLRSSYAGLLIIGQLEVAAEGRSASGIPVRNVFPSGTAPRFRPVFARQGEMIDLFESWFGPYPFDVYGAAVVFDDELPARNADAVAVLGAHPQSRRRSGVTRTRAPVVRQLGESSALARHLAERGIRYVRIAALV